MEQARLYQSVGVLGDIFTENSHFHCVWISGKQPSSSHRWLPLQLQYPVSHVQSFWSRNGAIERRWHHPDRPV